MTEYGKVVSLAKYLKESGVPLYWFLMANRDLVLTEDSPGAVDGLVKESDYFRGITIKGGVDLGVQGNYVYDAEAVKIINEALSKFPETASGKTSLSSDHPNMLVPGITRGLLLTISVDMKRLWKPSTRLSN